MSDAYIRSEVIPYVVTNEILVFMNCCNKYSKSQFFTSVDIRNKMFPRKVI